MSIQILAVLGFLLSVYAFKTEQNIKKHKKYKALCDFNKEVSCSKTFSSKYSHVAGFSNSLAGIFFYILIFVLAAFNFQNYIFYLAVLSFLGSIYLAYLSFFKLKNFCLICTFIYLINILLLIVSL